MKVIIPLLLGFIAIAEVSATPPKISNISDQQITRNQATPVISFLVADAESPANVLVITAASSNQELVPDHRIFLGGQGTNRTLIVSPLTNQVGSTVVTVTVSDTTGESSRDEFLLTVTPAGTPPRISQISNQEIIRNSISRAIVFAVVDSESSPNQLTITGSSSNKSLIPDSGILLGGFGQDRLVILTPATNRTGVSFITLTVTDLEGLSSSTTFQAQVLVRPPEISLIPDQVILKNQPSKLIPFSVTAAGVSPDAISITTFSSNTDLIPHSKVYSTGSGSERSLLIIPNQDQLGSATITITATAEGVSATQTFQTVVSNSGSDPIISAIGNQTTFRNQTSKPISFFVYDEETASNLLTIKTESSNQVLVPNPSILVGGSGTNRFLVITPSANESGTATITVSVIDSNGQNAKETFEFTVTTTGNPPAISNIPAQTTVRNRPSSLIPFEISDADTPFELLRLAASSSDQTLVPNNSIFLGGAGANRTIFITPSNNQIGMATITVTVTDSEGLSAFTNFTFTIDRIGTPPEISPITDIQIPRYQVTPLIPFNISDAETAANLLVVEATSSNQSLIPNPFIYLGGTGRNRNMLIAPPSGQVGTAEVTLSVSDSDGHVAFTKFRLTVAPIGTSPTISTIPEQVVTRNQPSHTIVLQVSDPGFQPNQLNVGIESSNLALIPTTNVQIIGENETRALIIRPATNQVGRAQLLVHVSNPDGVKATTEFTVNVLSPGTPPSLSDITNQRIERNTPTTAIPFKVSDIETPTDQLSVQAISSNPMLVPERNIYLLGTGTDRSLFIIPAQDITGTSLITLHVIDEDGHITEKSFNLTVGTIGEFPKISEIPAQRMPSNQSSLQVAFTVSDAETSPSQLKIAVSSSNETLFPKQNLIVSGDGAARTLLLRPSVEVVGSATITITVMDSNTQAASRSFTVRVTSVGAPPIISQIPDQRSYKNNPTAVVPFTISDGETPAKDLTVLGKSSNHSLIPDRNIFLGGVGSQRTLSLLPLVDQHGTASITITVIDSDGEITEQFVQLTVSPSSKFNQYDLTGDGRSDILLRERSGSLALWTMVGENQLSTSLLSLSNDGDDQWIVAGTGEFNRDGQTDLLFQHEDGTIAMWFLNGTNQISATLLNPTRPTDPKWRIAGSIDWNKDQKTDLVLQNSENGMIGIWFLDGVNLISGQLLHPNSPGDMNWTIQAIADFDQDTHIDLLFQHTDGTMAIWFCEGANLKKAALIDPEHPGDHRWRVVGSADVDLDSTADILFQHEEDGTLAVWLMDGYRAKKAMFINPSNPGIEWKAVSP